MLAARHASIFWHGMRGEEQNAVDFNQADYSAYGLSSTHAANKVGPRIVFIAREAIVHSLSSRLLLSLFDKQAF
jgi:hypothetical protein